MSNKKMIKKNDKTKKKERLAAKERRQLDMRKKDHSFLYYAYPPNLIHEVRLYGFKNFGAKDIVTMYIAACLLSFAVGMIFKLRIQSIIVLAIGEALFIPSVVHNTYKNKYEDGRFADLATYMKQMLRFFKLQSNGTCTRRIGDALKSVRESFREETPMRESIDSAVNIIYKTYDDDVDVKEKGLAEIEKRYRNDKLSSVHAFLRKAEADGGEVRGAVDLLLKDIALWQKRVNDLKTMRTRQRLYIFVTIVGSLLMCPVMMRLAKDIDISSTILVQASSVLAILIDTLIFLKADKKLAVDLLDNGADEKTEKKAVTEYYRVLNYNEKKEMKNSLLLSIIPLCIVVYGAIKSDKAYLFAGLIVMCVTMSQHVIGHKLAIKTVKREIEKQFSNWLLEMTLLMQSNNVHVSIFLTINDDTPAILRPELEKLRDAITEDPNSNKPFLDFFKDFDLPEVSSAMKMIYSISKGSGVDKADQIADIVDGNIQAMDRAQQIINEDSLSGLDTLFWMPFFTAGGLIFCYLMVYMIAFLQIATQAVQ